jgi:RNA polymerase sigma-70 factor (ECF subfamily)
MKTKAQINSAVDELYQKIQSFIRRRVSAEQDQEDLIQEIFLKFKKNIFTVQDQDRLLPWLYRIAANQINDYYRSRSRAPLITDHLEKELEIEDQDNSVAQEVAGWLKFFIRNLKPEDQEILRIIELEGKTQKEAAELLGITLTATKSRHQRAKARLKNELEACCRYFLDARGKITGYQQRSGLECKCN